MGYTKEKCYVCGKMRDYTLMRWEEYRGAKATGVHLVCDDHPRVRLPRRLGGERIRKG